MALKNTNGAMASVMCFIWGLGVRDRELKVFLELQRAYQAYEKKKKLIRKLVRRCALLSKYLTKLTLQQKVSLDFKIAFQQCMVVDIWSNWEPLGAIWSNLELFGVNLSHKA